MSSHVKKAKLYFCFDGEWVQHNDVWDFAYKSKHGVKLKVNITHQKLLAYAIEKCGIDSAVGETKLVYMNDGSIFELTDDGHVSDFMQFAFESDIPPALFVYVVPSMCNEGDDEGQDEGEDEGDDEGEDEGDDETHVGECSQFETSYDATFNPDHTFVPETQGLEEEEEEVEVEDEGRRFVGVADDETYVFTVGISDFDNSDTDNDEEYVPSNKSFGELNDYFDMPPPLRTSETSIPTYQPAPYNRSSRIREGQMFETKDEMIIQLGIKCIEEGFERKVKKSDKERYVAVCAIKNCNWRFTARSVGAKGGMFHVTSLHDVHTCSRTQLNPNHRQADKRTLGHMLKGKFLDASRAFRPKDIMNDINDQYGITIGYHQSWRARCRALLLVRGTPEESYERLPTYLYNLELNNPGTRTRIRADSKGRFELCFVALGPAVRILTRHMFTHYKL